MRQVLRGAATERRRLGHTVVATALAVSLLVGTLLFTDAVRSSFRSASRAQAGAADLLVRSAAEFATGGTTVSERAPVPESLVPVVAGVAGVDSAWGMVWGFAQPVDEQGRSMAPEGRPSVGTGWSPSASLVGGRAPSGPDEVAIDSGTARSHDVHVGDRVKVVFENSVATFSVAALVDSAASSSSLVAFTPETAQARFGEEGGFSAIAVETGHGPATESLRTRIGAVLPPAFEVVSADQLAAEATDSWTGALGFLEVSLLIFSAVALLVGALVIANTFSILVSQRARQLALLRALGASRGQVLTTVLAEAVSVGLLASALGVVAGLAIARGLVVALSGVGFDLGGASLRLAPGIALVGLACGVVVTAVAALLPARRASGISAVEGISGQTGTRSRGLRRQARVGGSWSAVGAVLLVVGLVSPFQPRVVMIGLGAVALLIGFFVAVPLLALPAARVIGLPLARVFGPSAALGRENAMRNPRRTGATAAALTIGIALVGVTGILGASMKASARRSVANTLRADLVVKPKPGDALSGLPPVAADRLRSIPGVGAVSEFRTGPWGLDGRAQTLLAVDPTTLGTVHELDAESQALAPRLQAETVLVRASTAARNGWKVGDRVPMTFARTGTRPVELVGTFSSPGPTDFVVSLATYEANFTQQRDTEIRVRLAPGASPQATRTVVEAALADFPTLQVLDRHQVLAGQQAQVDRVLMPVIALLGLSVIIALVGIANTLALSIHERTREIGLLRSIGMARGQLRAMIRSEAVIIAALGAGLGVALATLLGWALVAALHGVGVTVLVLPVRQLTGWLAVATVAAMMAAILPARRAAAIPALEAVGTPLG